MKHSKYVNPLPKADHEALAYGIFEARRDNNRKALDAHLSTIVDGALKEGDGNLGAWDAAGILCRAQRIEKDPVALKTALEASAERARHNPPPAKRKRYSANPSARKPQPKSNPNGKPPF
jgi:hypothetical protein